MIESIKKILLEKHWKSTNSSMQLKDNDSEMTVQLKDLPAKGLLINIPQGKAHLGMASSVKGLQQSCDKLILIDREEHVDAYFIEMKEKIIFNPNDVPRKPAEQILHTMPTLEYIFSMAKAHCGKSKKIKSHFIVIAQNVGPGMHKQKMRYSPIIEKFQYRNERFKLVSSFEEISLKHL